VGHRRHGQELPARGDRSPCARTRRRGHWADGRSVALEAACRKGGATLLGADPATTDPNRPDFGPAASLNGMYTEVLAAMARHLGMRLQRVVTEHRAYAASKDLQIAAGAIPRGRISHFNWRWRGFVDERSRLTMSIHWYMETAHLDDPQPPLWRTHIAGQPGVMLRPLATPYRHAFAQGRAG